MRAQFIRGADTREEIIDTLLDRRITIEIIDNTLVLNNNGNLDKKENEDLLKLMKRNKVQHKINLSRNLPAIRLTGTKEQLIPVVARWDSNVRSDQEAEEALRKNWDGTYENLFDILG